MPILPSSSVFAEGLQDACHHLLVVLQNCTLAAMTPLQLVRRVTERWRTEGGPRRQSSA